MILSSYFTNTAATPTNGGSIPTDVYNKVSKLMQSQSAAAPRLNAALSADKTVLSGLGQLQSALATFQGVAKSLTGSGLNLSANSSAKDVLTAGTSSKSMAGSYSIVVSQLAQGQVLRTKSQDSATAPIGNGAATRISFEFGNSTGNSFSTNSAANAARSLSLPAGAQSLDSLAAAINGAKIGVTAKVVASDGGQALELTSPSGAAGSMRISASGNPALQALLGYNPTGDKNLVQISAAQNAALTINGVAVESPSNAVGNAIPGTTLNLAGKGSSKLDIVQGSAQLVQNVTNLVNAYNTLNAKLTSLNQGDLKSDGVAARIQNQLARVFTGSGLSAQGLAKIGITPQKNGDLVIDPAKLQNAINSDPAGIANLFTNGGRGIADTLASQIQAQVGPSGVLPKKTSIVNQDIASLTNKKASLEKALTAQANALVKYFTTQSGTGGTTGATGGNPSLFDYVS